MCDAPRKRQGFEWPASASVPSPHGFSQVEPAAQDTLLPPLHRTVHASVPPQVTVHPELPPQSAVHPPLGQPMVQVLLPVHDTVEPTSTSTLHVLPPAHVTALFVPVERVQLLVPAHDDVQFDVHVPLQVDWPSHVVVHPVPHVALQLFFEPQLKVASLGGAVLADEPSPPASPVAPAPPNVHVPPARHVQVLPVHVQSPVHAPPLAGTLPLLPQPAASETPSKSAEADPKRNQDRGFDMEHLRRNPIQENRRARMI